MSEFVFSSVGGSPATDGKRRVRWPTITSAPVAPLPQPAGPIATILDAIAALRPEPRPPMRRHLGPAKPPRPTLLERLAQRLRRPTIQLPKDTTMVAVPLEIKLALAAVASKITQAQDDVAVAQARVNAIRARIADADFADAELAKVAEADDGAALAQIATGKSGSEALRKQVDKAGMLRRAADAAGRNLGAAELQLAAAEAVRDEYLDERKELRGRAMVAARSELDAKFAAAVEHLKMVAGHLAGAHQATCEAGNAWFNFPDTDLRMMCKRIAPEGEYLPPDAVEFRSIFAVADAEVVASAKAAWIQIAESL